MNISEIMKEMIQYSDGNLHDISHFLKVHGYAETIGKCEGLDPETQKILEIAAILHDIACPLCRRKYGNTDGKHQESEGMILAREFLSDKGLTEAENDRIIFLVGHHHTLRDIEGDDYQILIEADYLVNADESSCSRENIQNFQKEIFRTKTGTELLKSIYCIL